MTQGILETWNTRKDGPLSSTAALPPVVRLIASGMAWFRSRIQTKAAAESPLRLVAQLSLGAKRSVSLVETGGIRFLVGGGIDSITVIAPVPGSAAATDGETLAEAGRP